MKLSRDLVSKIDLKPYVNLITRVDHKSIFLAPPGKNHYGLLAYIASQLNNTTIIELGTHNGTSSTALSTNSSNKIITFDVRSMYTVQKQPENVERVLGNIFELGMENLMLESSFIFLDTLHQGDFEWKVYSFLKENNYKGILLLDDIHWNEPMKKFWKKITTTKYDITEIGHGVCPNGAAGTGLVDFGNKVDILEDYSYIN